MDVGIAVLGLFLVCSAVQDVAQAPSGTPGDTVAQAGQGTQQATNVEAVQRQEISRLRAEVDRLQREVARMREQLAQTGLPTQGETGAGTGGAGNEGTGTGGAGSAGIGDPSAEAPAGQVGLGDAAGEGIGGGGRAGGAQAARPETDDEGTAVANIIYTGRVRSVSQGQLVLDVGEGISNSLTLARDVRVFRGRQEVAFKTLREGTFVRASADLYARGNPVVRIEVLPTSERQAPQEE
jgi:TolA-binding protein